MLGAIGNVDTNAMCRHRPMPALKFSCYPRVKNPLEPHNDKEIISTQSNEVATEERYKFENGVCIFKKSK